MCTAYPIEPIVMGRNAATPSDDNLQNREPCTTKEVTDTTLHEIIPPSVISMPAPDVHQPALPNTSAPPTRNRKPVPVAPGKSYTYVPPKFTQLHRPFFFDTGSDVDFTPSLLPVVPFPPPFDTPHAATSDAELEESFTSALDGLTSPESCSSSEATHRSGQSSATADSDDTAPPRRSSRQARAPPRLVYDEGFTQHLVRTTTHQKRRPPTPVKKHPSQESRDKVKLMRGKSVSKK